MHRHGAQHVTATMATLQSEIDKMDIFRKLQVQ